MSSQGYTKLPGAKASLFSYDNSSPLDPTTVKAYSVENSRVLELQYQSGDRTVSAYRVDPLFTLPMGRAIFLHPSPGNKGSFLEDAKMLAERGMSSLLIDAPWSSESFGERASRMSPSEFRDLMIATVIDVRRGADLLTMSATRGNVAFVGHSLGAMIGGILSAVDKRFRAEVLLSGVGRFSDVAAANRPQGGERWLSEFRQAAEDIDPVGYVITARDTLFLFQLGLEDHFFPRSKLVELFDAAVGSKDLIWYEGDHFTVNELGRADRIEWLDVRMPSL